ncbi:MAG: Rho termination factor N-terminal domain-containing protein [Desulfobacterales bacterium]
MGSKKKEEKEKPLEKMTIKELREIAKGIEGIVGASGMNKDELLTIIRKDRGIAEPVKKSSSNIRDLKKRIREFKGKLTEVLEAGDQKMAGIWRERIIRLKKKTRRLA